LSTGRIARPNRVDARRPLFHSLIAGGTLPAAGAYFVERGPDGTAVETPLDTRRL
jgi:hypothetical protein